MRLIKIRYIYLSSLLFLVTIFAANAQTPYQLQFGKNETFIPCNYHQVNTIIPCKEDFQGPLPDENDRIARSNYNGASVYLTGRPGRCALELSANVGYTFNATNGEYQWNEIKNLPVEIRITYDYVIEANWEEGRGSANAHIFDFYGRPIEHIGGYKSEVHISGKNYESEKTVVFPMNFSDLKNKHKKIYLRASCEVDTVENAQRNHISSSEVDIKKIDIVFNKLPSRTGEIDVTSMPPGAIIYLNKKEQEKRSNCVITDVEPGDYEVTYELLGYYNCVKEIIKVNAGERTPCHCDMEPKPSPLKYLGWFFTSIGFVLIIIDRKKDAALKFGASPRIIEYSGPIGGFLLILGIIILIMYN